MYRLFLLSLIPLAYLINACHNTTPDSPAVYYVSPAGMDSNPGTSEKPWKTLSRINELQLKPGDRIILKGGEVYTGTLLLDSLDSGKPGNQVIISSLGGHRAVIRGGDSAGISVSNCRFFTLKNLVVEGSGRKSGNMTNGIEIKASNDFIADSIEVHGFQHSGIKISGSRNARITNIYAHDNGFAGIHVTGPNANHAYLYDNENLYIGYCVAGNNPGDPTVTDNHSGNGILASSVNGGIIEYCEAYNNGWDMPWTGNGPVGIWIWDARDFTIQYCISHNNKTNPAAKDGGGFDLDGGVSGSVIRYCISYNNQGAGYGLFEFGAEKPWEKNTVHHNVSLNDGLINEGSLAVWKNDSYGIMRDCGIYNNIFYNDTLKGVSVSFISNCDGFRFRKNLFVYSGSFTGPGQKIASETFEDNLFRDLSGSKSMPHGLAPGNNINPVFRDPRLGDLSWVRIRDPRLINEILLRLPM